MEQVWTNNLTTQAVELDLANQPVNEVLQKCLLTFESDTDVVLINVLTICRNVCCALYPADSRKDILSRNTIDDVVEQVIHTLQVLTSTVHVCYTSTIASVPRYIVLYMFDYDKFIPSDYYRVPTDHFTQLVEQKLKARISVRNNCDLNNTTIEFYPDTDKSSYIALNELVQSMQNNHKVLMISHHPIDYHLNSLVNKWRLVSSFTGDIKLVDDLGKTVFGTSDIPFTLATHIAFGDRVDMKQSIKRGSKKELVEIAQKEMWNLLSNEQLVARLHELQINQPYHI